MNKPRSLWLLGISAAAFAGVSYFWQLKTPHSMASPQSLAAATDGRSKDAVIAIYKLQEKAVQTGDGNLYFSLRSRQKLEELGDKQAQEQLRKQFAGDPSVRYELDAVKMTGDHAALLGRIKYATSAGPQFYQAKFVFEDGSWKIADDKISGEPINIVALEAALPPKDGAFIRLGSPWDKVPYAGTNGERFKESQIDWKMQATVDESFLYIRFAARTSLPSAGSEIEAETAKSLKGMPSAPDSMIIKTGAGKEFELQVAANPMIRGTFDASGHATSNRYFAQYSLTLRDRAGNDLFSDGTSDSFAPLIGVQDQYLEVKLPLKCLGISSAPLPIEIREVNSLAKILPYSVSSVTR